jgi:hypothetical protein
MSVELPRLPTRAIEEVDPVGGRGIEIDQLRRQHLDVAAAEDATSREGAARDPASVPHHRLQHASPAIVSSGCTATISRGSASPVENGMKTLLPVTTA